jgi:hypothetical protein
MEEFNADESEVLDFFQEEFGMTEEEFNSLLLD